MMTIFMQEALTAAAQWNRMKIHHEDTKVAIVSRRARSRRANPASAPWVGGAARRASKELSFVT